ncbi:MAG: nickel pincer cofactor biosynthesis protein LarB [bacterium]|nr:nickel pincer cofactor biosynthesis protein LarB [bacterium]
MKKNNLLELLEQVQQKKISVTDAFEKVKGLPYEKLGCATLDNHRMLRHGFPEVIFCLGKTKKQVVEIAKRILSKEDTFLATRATRDVYLAVKKIDKRVQYNEAGRVIYIPNNGNKGMVTIVTAGTSDIPVAEEARITAQVMGSKAVGIYDVGVAGIHRILDKRDILEKSRVIVVIAGMDGALPSVVGGLVGKPIIAVPTSVGYGANFGGIAPLLTMLNSCASNVAVVNIDNGFGAGYIAHLINIQN